MINKKRTISLVTMAFLLLLYSYQELQEKYSELEIFRRKEHQLKSLKSSLPMHNLEEAPQFFFPVIKVISGISRIIKPTIQLQTGVSRIEAYQPKKRTLAELRERAKQEKFLREILSLS